MVSGGGSHSRDHEFESPDRIIEKCFRIVMRLETIENEEKGTEDRPFKNNDVCRRRIIPRNFCNDFVRRFLQDKWVSCKSTNCQKVSQQKTLLDRSAASASLYC